jgi:hypothetical protein
MRPFDQVMIYFAKYDFMTFANVLYPGKGECADPVNEDAILEKEGGGEPQDQSGERQLASDTGGGKT